MQTIIAASLFLIITAYLLHQFLTRDLADDDVAATERAPQPEAEAPPGERLKAA
jgi:hypothetical protein